MKIIKGIREMKSTSLESRKQGKIISFVPTMGYLHEGHLSLMREGRRRGDFLVVSVFVNPTQFGPGEDFERYPRDLARDARMAEGVGVDILFAPSATDMYPRDHQTTVNVTRVTEGLCGRSRPGHFQGVTTVVTMLFNIVMPHVAIFGEKDFQQLVTIKQMVKDLHMDVEIVGMPTVREPDGLAMSSRNSYLTPEERRAALSIPASLRRAEELFKAGERRSVVIIEEMRKIIQSEPLMRIDYIEVCEPETLQRIETVEDRALVAVAAFSGNVRLIDNLLFRSGAGR